MLGTFQQSYLRIEVDAPATDIARSLLHCDRLKQWLSLQTLPPGLPEKLSPGLSFNSHIGPVSIGHHVEIANTNHVRLLLSGGIDGFHEWYWGDGWIQSRLEGVSLLPLKLGQTLSLLQLRQFLVSGSRQ
ncbi:MAG: hypothetical protein WBB29_11690 [Geitlerinemataceae cyanobacterium]